MINANELRIGNIISAKTYNHIIQPLPTIWDFHDCTVNRISEFRLIVNTPCGSKEDVIIENVKPILLTEKWLLKLGFKKVGGRFELDIITVFDYLHELKVEVPEGGREDWGKWLNHIKYVHQIQNLYFALTGEELPLK